MNKPKYQLDSRSHHATEKSTEYGITSEECDHVRSIRAAHAGARNQERGRQPLGSCPSTTLTLSDFPLTSTPKLLRTPTKHVRPFTDAATLLEPLFSHMTAYPSGEKQQHLSRLGGSHYLTRRADSVQHMSNSCIGNT